ncbi:MAG TPA: hypothetical protein VGP26_24685 [Actinophytocola sp.]|nr:hypothetical protein [Actinophytocola sp.]
MTAVPPIPVTCAHRPTIGGLVRPWINVELADGGLDFRSQHRRRAEHAITARLCQVCGTPLRHPVVLLGGPDQLRRLMFGEPPLHPECAAYTSYACPMVAGRMASARTAPALAEGPRGAACPDDGCDCGGWTNHSNPGGADAHREPHPWFAIYATAYSHVRDQHGTLLAITSPDAVRRVRLVSRPGEGRYWRAVRDALAGYEPPAFVSARE